MFLSLPRDAMEAIMLRLRPHDIINCARVCNALKAAAYSEQLWQNICERQFAETCPRTWLVPTETVAAAASSAFAEPGAPLTASQGDSPTIYRYLTLAMTYMDGGSPSGSYNDVSGITAVLTWHLWSPRAWELTVSWLRFRSLYPILERYGGVVGLWRSVGEGPVGSFYQFRWGRDCVEGVQLVYHSPLRCTSAQ